MSMSKMLHYRNYRMRFTIQDGRQLIGKFMAFDRHMNLVLGDCEEFRKLPPIKGSKEEREDRRTLGLVILRGEEVISITVEGPPHPDESRVKAAGANAVPGPGIGRAAGRGVPTGPACAGTTWAFWACERSRRTTAWNDAAADLAPAADFHAADFLSSPAAGIWGSGSCPKASVHAAPWWVPSEAWDTGWTDAASTSV